MTTSYSRVGGQAAAPTSLSLSQDVQDLRLEAPLSLPPEALAVLTTLAEVGPALQRLSAGLEGLKPFFEREPTVQVNLNASVYAAVEALAEPLAKAIQIKVEPAAPLPAPAAPAVINKIDVPKMPLMWLIFLTLLLQLPGLAVLYAVCRG